MRRLRTSIVLAVGLLVATSSIAGAASSPKVNQSADSAYKGATLDTSSAIVVLKQAPVTTYDGHVAGYAKTRPDHGKLNPNSAAAKKYLGYLKSEHSAFAKWLQTNVPSAKITSQFYVALNGIAVSLNGNAIGKLANNTDVLTVEYNALYHPTMSESYKIINASGAWGAAGGRSTAGAGIKIGDIDTGIDQGHPFFDPTGFSYPAGFPKCDAQDSSTHTANSSCKYVTPKVIVAKVFTNKLNQNGFDAKAVQDHGTHTAGTAAGVTGHNAVVQGVTIDDMSGIAPGAWLGNYNVFPGDIANARSEDILNAVDAAVADGMDVLNLSLGGGYHGNNDLLAMGLDNAVAANVVVAVSAGNSGPGGNTIGSPGRARNIITAGASTNQHFIGEPFTYPATTGTTIGAAVGDFDPLPTASFSVADTASLACNAGTPGTTSTNNPPLGTLTGKLALVNRGACTFSEKVANAKAAGAIAVVVINNVAGDPTAMARSAGFEDGIPAVMIGLAEGAALRTAAPTTASAVATFSEFVTANADILAGFSSQGPTSVDLAIKPDLTSVGVNVLSSITTIGNTGDIWAFFSGTSMAAPHIAGSAAVLLAIHPTWSPAQVKSALVNTSDRVIRNAKTGTLGVGPQAQGAGRENLSNASDANLFLSPSSASFGKVVASKATALTIKLSNSLAIAQTFTLSATKFTPAAGTLGILYNAGTTSAGDSRISFPGSVTVQASSSATITVWVNAGPAGSVVQGWIQLANGSNTYHFAYWALRG